MEHIRHPIRVTAHRTGLSPDVIRAWEKRYEAVKPCRTGTNRRLYTEAEIERLTLLRDATRAGHSIGHVAALATEQLRTLGSNGSPPVGGGAEGGAAPAASRLLEQCVEAIRGLDAPALARTLEHALSVFGRNDLLHKVISPLAVALGDSWRAGTIMAAHEHLASWTIRLFLGKIMQPLAANATHPTVAVGTPVGQLHELGAVMVAAVASDLGWRVTYLGTSLPAKDIAGAAVQCRARAVALSIVYPDDDPHLPTELKTLRRLLPRETAILAGGRAIAAYRSDLDKIGAIQCNALPQLHRHLEDLRRP